MVVQEYNRLSAPARRRRSRQATQCLLRTLPGIRIGTASVFTTVDRCSISKVTPDIRIGCRLADKDATLRTGLATSVRLGRKPSGSRLLVLAADLEYRSAHSARTFVVRNFSRNVEVRLHAGSAGELPGSEGGGAETLWVLLTPFSAVRDAHAGVRIVQVLEQSQALPLSHENRVRRTGARRLQRDRLDDHLFLREDRTERIGVAVADDRRHRIRRITGIRDLNRYRFGKVAVKARGCTRSLGTRLRDHRCQQYADAERERERE